jgi:hypothetical protein
MILVQKGLLIVFQNKNKLHLQIKIFCQVDVSVSIFMTVDFYEQFIGF